MRKNYAVKKTGWASGSTCLALHRPADNPSGIVEQAVKSKAG